jgi:hypothetical protein
MGMKLVLENNKLDMLAAGVCGIYGFQFPDGKWLVGYSSYISRRPANYYQHRSNLKFKDGIEKYGWSSIKMYILEECENNKEILLQKEKEWSDKLDSFNNGYNAMQCGKIQWASTAEVYDNKFCSKVSESMVKWHKNRKNISKSKYRNWKKLWNSTTKNKSYLLFVETLVDLPETTAFGIEWNTLSKWNRKRIKELLDKQN